MSKKYEIPGWSADDNYVAGYGLDQMINCWISEGNLKAVDDFLLNENPENMAENEIDAVMTAAHRERRNLASWGIAMKRMQVELERRTVEMERRALRTKNVLDILKKLEGDPNE